MDIEGKERSLGTSYFNDDESIAVRELLEFLCRDIGQSPHFNEKGAIIKGDNKRSYRKESFWVLSPYTAQSTRLKAELGDFGMTDQVVTIDSAQGRENDFVIMSMVRSNKNKNVGFLK